MRRKWQISSYKSKILVGLVFMSALPIVILTIFSYTIIRKNIREQMDIMADSTAAALKESMEKTLDNVSTSYMEIVTVESVNTVITSDISYRDYHIYADAIKILEGPAYLEKYLRHFTLINLETDWVLSRTGMYAFTDADNRDEVLKLLEKDPYRTAYLVNDLQMSDNIGGASRGTLPHNTIDLTGAFMVFKLPVATVTPRSVLIVNLDMEGFYLSDDRQSIYEITVLDEANQVLITTDAATARVLAGIAGQLEEQDNLKLENNRKVQIGAVTTDSRYFKYIVTYDRAALGRLEGQIIGLVLALNVVIFLVIIVTTQVGGHIYRPIQDLTDMISDAIQDEKVPDGDEILFIGRNVRNLADTVQNQKNILAESLVSRLFSGTIREEEIIIYLNELKQPALFQYNVVALGFDADAKWDSNMEKSIILNAVAEELSGKLKARIFLEPKIVDRNLVFLVGGDTGSQSENNIEDIRRTLEIYLEKQGITNMRLGVSRTFHALKHTYRAEREAVEASKTRDSKKHRGAIKENLHLSMYENIALNTDKIQPYPLDAEAKIREWIDLHREQEAFAEIDLFVDKLFSGKIAVTDRRYYLYSLFLSILEVLSDAGLSVETMKTEEEDLFLAFWQIYEAEDVKRFLKRNVAAPVIRTLKEFRSANTQYIKEMVMNLIKKSKGDISLAECAEKLNYNANYLGRILRCENNVSFTDYVAKQKFEYAKELLRETERSVADIAQELNYTNTQNFIRFFNKQAGMTPGKYRQQSREDNMGESD